MMARKPVQFLPIWSYFLNWILLLTVLCNGESFGVFASERKRINDVKENSPLMKLLDENDNNSNNNNNNHELLETLQVVFCGFGRTGTHSLGAALDRLGYKSLHGEEISLNSLGTHQLLGEAIMARDVEALLTETARMGYNATLEQHAFFWRDIREFVLQRQQQHQMMMNVKFIFMIRDFEPWFESMVATYNTLAIMQRFPANLIPLHQRIVDILAVGISHELNVSTDTVRKLFAKGNSTQHYELRRRVYNQYVQDVHEIMAMSSGSDQVLLFNVREGYAPLCAFLKIEESKCPTPDLEPFPHLSDRAHMMAGYYFLRVLECTFYVLMAVAVWLLCKIGKYVLARKPGQSDSPSSTQNETKLKKS
ncbi:hypothetical protein ACA910_017696 [Epithemia clementina (nom. ined.)]